MSEWRPRASLDALRRRAALLANIRAFFAERNVLEVETPVLSAAGSVDPHLDIFSTDYRTPGVPAARTRYLQTSPEFAMKRLLAAGSGPIFQITKAFRNGEVGRQHNPEFTMLEWYRPGYDHHALMNEVDALLQRVLGTPPSARHAYGELFESCVGINPHGASAEELRARAFKLDIHTSMAIGDEVDTWLQLLWTHVVESHLVRRGGTLFVTDYPASQAMLARVRPGPPAVAERFELYVNGVELANGFHELTDGGEQRRRFDEDCKRREALEMPPMPIDEYLLAALNHGLPDCSGVALGVDRLLMLSIGASEIADVLAFPADRC